MNIVRIGALEIGMGRPLALIAGPCVISNREDCLELAEALVQWSRRAEVPFIFKASFDKANRTSGASFRGLGMERGLAILAEVKERFGVPVLTDVHETGQVEAVAQVVDILQIPAFLCRQTDLIVAAAKTGRAMNIKKGQFLAPEDMRAVLAKAEGAGNRRLLATERGVCFGYHNLVADMRSLLVLRELGYPVVFDATHSVQRPGGAGDHSGGDGRWAPALARAAVATGACDAIFIETYLSPEKALSDRENSIPFDRLPSLWEELRRIHGVVAH